MSCCNDAYGSCRSCLEPMWAVMRCLENIPGLGHIMALIYACMGLMSKAERAAIKASIGIILGFISFPAEIFDELGRHRSKKIYSANLANRTKWMKSFARRPLRYMCLPASHQSGTYTTDRKLKPIPLIGGWSVCQRLNIQEQLDGGIRFLDLRLMSDDKNEIWLHHNVITCIKFKEVLAVVRDFVQNYPSEIVALHIDADGKHLDWNSVHGCINEYLGPKLIQEHMSDMCIGDIVDYGKNIVVFGVPSVAYSWKCLDKRWPNKAWPSEIEEDMTRVIADLNTYNPYYLFWYKAEVTVNATCIVRNLGGIFGVIVAKCSEEKFEFLEDVGAAMNYRIMEILENTQMLPFHVISTDYVDDQILGQIIEMNAAEITGCGKMARTSAFLNTSTVSAGLSPPGVSPGALSQTTETSLESDSLLRPASPRVEVWESTM